MNCQTVRPLLDGYAAGSLPDPDRELVRRHCAECPDCSADLRNIGDIRRVSAEQPAWVPPPAYFSNLGARINRRIAERETPWEPSRGIRFALPAAAMIVSVIALIWLSPRPAGVTPARADGLTSISTAELQEYLERQEVVGLAEPVSQSVRSDDLSVLKEIVRSDSVYIYPDPETDSDLNGITGKDAENLAALLESPGRL